MKIIQVAALFDPDIRRDHPYFIICVESDCPSVTKKTPIHKVPIVQAQDVPVISQPTGKDIYRTQKPHHANTDQSADTNGSNVSNPLAKYRVHFSYASADVTERYRKILSSFITDYDPGKPEIRVTGFTDSTVRDTGKIPNEWLALERAVSVKKYLISLGYPEPRILLEARELCCYIASNKTERGRQINRRVDLTLIN